MGFHGFLEVVITSNLGGPVGVVGGLGEVSGGYNLQNLAWTFADAAETLTMKGNSGMIIPTTPLGLCEHSSPSKCG